MKGIRGRALWRWVRQAEWLSELTFIPLALLFSWSLLVIGGVPMTHDGLGLAITETYRRAYKAGQYFPLWTVFFERGHGSAVPLLYHRLHVQLCALLALMTGTRVAVKASIPALLFVGAIGIRRLCRFHGARPWVAWIAGILLMSANYTVADWYVRGATAELMAFMLIPWGLRYAAELFERRWGAVRFAAASSLIFFAHMMTFYFYVPTAAAVVLGALWRLRMLGRARLRAALGRAFAAGILLTAAIGPWAAAVTYVSEFCGSSGIDMRTDAGAFAHWSIFFIDPDLSWSRAVVEGQMSWEIGRWIFLCLGICVVMAPGALGAVWRRAGGLALLAAFFLVLQRQELTFFFKMLPGASKIQFPSRLLVFVTTIAILCAAIAIEAALRSRVPFVRVVARVSPLVAAACQGNVAHGTQSAIWGWNRDKAFVEESLSDPTDVSTKRISANGWPLFLPRRHGSDPAQQPFLATSDNCMLSSPTLTAGAPARSVAQAVPLHALSFTVHGQGCTVKLDQYQSSILRVELSQEGRVSEADDGTTVIEAPDGTVVHLGERSVMDLAKKFLIEKTRRFP